MTTYVDRLEKLGACPEALDWCRANHPTDLRAAWEGCESAGWMLWILTRLNRRRGVGVTVEVVRATCAHLAPDEVTTEVLNPLAAWAAGDGTVDVAAVRGRAWEIRRSAAYAYAAAYAADRAAAASTAYAAYAAAYADATAYAAAWSAAAYAAAAAHAAAAAAAAYAYAYATAAAHAAYAYAYAAVQATMIRGLVSANEVTRMFEKG